MVIIDPTILSLPGYGFQLLASGVNVVKSRCLFAVCDLRPAPAKARQLPMFQEQSVLTLNQDDLCTAGQKACRHQAKLPANAA